MFAVSFFEVVNDADYSTITLSKGSRRGDFVALRITAYCAELAQHTTRRNVSCMSHFLCSKLYDVIGGGTFVPLARCAQ